MEIVKVSDKEAAAIISSFDPAKSWPEDHRPRGRFIHEEGGQYIGIDNKDGCCWVEEFDDEETCRAWLLGEFEMSDYHEAREAGPVKWRNGAWAR